MTDTRTKPFYAVAGVGDLAVEKLREAQSALTGVKLDTATLQKEAQALPGRATAIATGVAAKGTEAYDELVVRGKDVVTRIRRQAATKDLQQKLNLTLRRAKVAQKTLVESAEATATARKSAQTVAKKRAAETRKAATKAAQAAGDTVKAARRAVADGAEKVG
jgi:heparin binding hemagglutinin HbhA